MSLRKMVNLARNGFQEKKVISIDKGMSLADMALIPLPLSANRVEAYQTIFNDIPAWKGHVPEGFLVDSFGVLVNKQFRQLWAEEDSGSTASGYASTLREWPRDVSGIVATKHPQIQDGCSEEWFECANAVMAAREAKKQFVMVTLGAHFGHQATLAHKTIQQLNPMPCMFVAVDAGPENCAWVAQHFNEKWARS